MRRPAWLRAIALLGTLAFCTPSPPEGRPGPAEPVTTVTWDPLSEPRREIDTLFLPDLTSWQTIDDGGGFLANDDAAPSSAVVANFEFGPGRFRPAVRGRPGSTNYIFYPLDGLIPSDEWTIEFWAKADGPWATLSSGVPVFALASTTNRLAFVPQEGRCALVAETLPTVPSASYSDTWSEGCDSLGLTAGNWHAVAMTYRDARLDIYVNGRLAGALEEVRWLPVWSDTTRSEGVQLSGTQGRSSNVWISDVRISRTARTPGHATKLRSLRGTLSVDARSARAPVPQNLVGALHPGKVAPPVVGAALETVRTDKLISATPIKRGAPDEIHPSAGYSGAFAYDWQVVDRTFSWLADRKLAAIISLDAAPQVLGGTVPPFAREGPPGQNLRRDLTGTAPFSPTPPNDLDAWSTIVRDLVHHVRNEEGYDVAWWSVWNEPDVAEFWAGTQLQYLDLYAKTALAVRSVDKDAKIGAGELASLNIDWLTAIFRRVAQDNLPLDFVAFHDYSGSLATLDLARAAVDARAAAVGQPTPFPILVSEFNWTLDNVYQPNCRRRFCDGFWHLRALTAAYTTSYLVRMVQLPGFAGLVYSHLETSSSYGSIREDGGFAVMQLVGADGRRWATFNALEAWKRAVGREIVSTSANLPPGVHALATRDPREGRLGVVLGNYGWSQRNSRIITLDIEGLEPGTYLLRRTLVDEAHSSRWDVGEDGVVGEPADGLQVVEARSVKVASRLVFDITLPRWSSTAVTLERLN